MMDSLAIQRGHGAGIEEEGQSALASLSQGFSSLVGTEGFSNDEFITDNGPGASNVPKGQCPEGYDKQSGKCLQKCIGCKYNDKMRSQEFNEGDPCFPNGVFNGYTNDGALKCTCGRDNQYCSESLVDRVTSAFTTDGLFVSGNSRQVATVGFSDKIASLFQFDQM